MEDPLLVIPVSQVSLFQRGMVVLNHTPAMMELDIKALVDASQVPRPSQDVIALSAPTKTPAARFTQTTAPQHLSDDHQVYHHHR